MWWEMAAKLTLWGQQGLVSQRSWALLLSGCPFCIWGAEGWIRDPQSLWADSCHDFGQIRLRLFLGRGLEQ